MRFFEFLLNIQFLYRVQKTPCDHGCSLGFFLIQPGHIDSILIQHNASLHDQPVKDLLDLCFCYLLAVNIIVQKFQGTPDQFFPVQEEMAFLLHGGLHNIRQAAGNPHGIIEPLAELPSNLIYRQKAEPFDGTEHIGALPYNLNRFIMEFLQDQVYLVGRHLIGRQEGHQFPEHLVLPKGFHNRLQLLPGNPPDL